MVTDEELVPGTPRLSREGLRTVVEGTLLGVILLLLLLLLGRGFGHYWDTWFYYSHATRWSDWFSSWWTGEASVPLADLRHYFPDQQRHPPLLEWGGGLCHALFSGVIGKVSSVRLFAELVAAFWSVATYVFLKSRVGWKLALVGVFLFWGSPRFLLHAVLYAIDGLIAAVYGLTLLALLAWDRGWKGKLLIYFALTVALFTKLQALYLIPILFLWVLFISLPERAGGKRGAFPLDSRLRGNDTFWGSVAKESAIAVAIVLAAGATWFVFWPALWLDFPKGLQDYLGFITKHGQIPVLYFGELFKGSVRPPWHYPLVFTFLALPLTLTLPVVVRLARIAWCAKTRNLQRFGREELLLWVGMVVPLFVSSLPQAPKYDGVRLLLPAYGPLSLLAALEIAAWWQVAREKLLSKSSAPVRNTLLLVIGILVLLPTVRIYPFNLVYYSPLIGGTFGARDRGFDLDYLGVAQNRLNPTIQQVARSGDILLLAGCNGLIMEPDKEGWIPVPQGVLSVDFKLVREIGYQGRKVFAIISSRYSDLVEDAHVVLREIPPLDTVDYRRGDRSERLFSLHEIKGDFVQHLIEVGSSPTVVGDWKP